MKRKAIIIGAGESGKILATKLRIEDEYGIELIGFLDDNIPSNMEIIYGLKVIGSISDLKQISCDYNVDEAFIAINNIDYEDLIAILDKCKKSKIFLRLSSNLFGVVPQKIGVENYGGIPVIDISPKINRNFILGVKKIFDIVLAFIGLIILLPFFLVIAFLIKVTSRGPIFYKDKRIGKKGRSFVFYKFRSMYVSKNGDSEREKEMIKFMSGEIKNEAKDTKVINNKRLTWIGKIIRRKSIDELPQLINVLKGDMSLVGPRPCLKYEFENMENWQKKRFDILPGCTGVWQVFGRGNVSFKDSVVLDLYYVNNMSPWLDIQLIIKTIPIMVFGVGGK
ncbi:MAG: hypothetical protein STSR0008_14190 [Ignavibacterium sp.]